MWTSTVRAKWQKLSLTSSSPKRHRKSLPSTVCVRLTRTLRRQPRPATRLSPTCSPSMNSAVGKKLRPPSSQMTVSSIRYWHKYKVFKSVSNRLLKPPSLANAKPDNGNTRRVRWLEQTRILCMLSDNYLTRVATLRSERALCHEFRERFAREL